MAFHTSVNYQIQAPPPYEDVAEDILFDIARIREESYASDYDFHIDISRSVKRLIDGHVVWVNYCYDSALYNLALRIHRLITFSYLGAFVNYLPIPLVLVEGETVHIAAEAYGQLLFLIPPLIPLTIDPNKMSHQLSLPTNCLCGKRMSLRRSKAG